MLNDPRRQPTRGTGGSSESGFTVIEVTIVMALLTVVSVILFGILGSLTNNERRTQALVSNEQEVRFVMDEILRDLRKSNPLSAKTYSSKTDYHSTVEMEQGTTTKTWVRWVYDGSAGVLTLRRETKTSLTDAWAGSTKLTRVQNANRSPAVPMFEYFSQSGKNLVTGPFSSVDVGNCAIRVRVTITANSNPGPEPFTVTADAHLRNRLPGGLGCG